MTWLVDENGEYYDDGSSASIYGGTGDNLVPTGDRIYGDTVFDLTPTGDPISSYGATTFDLTPYSSVNVTEGMTPVQKAALRSFMEDQSNANTTGGGPGPATNYLASLVAAVKSGALSSEAIKNLSAPVQAAVTKALNAPLPAAPSFLDKIGDFLGTTTGKAIGIGGLAALLQTMGNKGTGEIYKGYQGGIPLYNADRTMNDIPTTTVDASGKTVARRPGQGGITYFSPMQYTPANYKPADATTANTTDAAATTNTVAKAMGGITGYAMGGLGSLGGYSDGGRLLRGPGDGISDSIPATIGQKQPARLADGEFVVPARVVSEIGNGSTEAGARKLYAMMDRVQKARGKTLKNVAANSKADKYLPA
jgi:hypothetical protein